MENPMGLSIVRIFTLKNEDVTAVETIANKED